MDLTDPRTPRKVLTAGYNWRYLPINYTSKQLNQAKKELRAIGKKHNLGRLKFKLEQVNYGKKAKI